MIIENNPNRVVDKYLFNEFITEAFQRVTIARGHVVQEIYLESDILMMVKTIKDLEVKLDFGEYTAEEQSKLKKLMENCVKTAQLIVAKNI